MSDGTPILASFILGAIIFFWVGVIVGEDRTQLEAIDNGLAQYNAKTGDFEWLDTLTKQQEPTP